MGHTLDAPKAGLNTTVLDERPLLTPLAYEQGSILLVSLVMLLVITISGLTAVKMATLEEKISGNYQDQQMAFTLQKPR